MGPNMGSPAFWGDSTGTLKVHTWYIVVMYGSQGEGSMLRAHGFNPEVQSLGFTWVVVKMSKL